VYCRWPAAACTEGRGGGPRTSTCVVGVGSMFQYYTVQYDVPMTFLVQYGMFLNFLSSLDAFFC